MALSRVPGKDELYVGGIFTLRRKEALANTGITHIVSVLNYDFKNFQGWEKYEYLSIEVDDVDDENLLGEFERTGKFIEDALKNGGRVLVHCAMGKSRSVTVVIAYLLRQNSQHTPSSALSLVRESRPIAEPNDGFMAQLELYKDMGCPRDIANHPKYQRWIYQQEVSLAIAAGMAPQRVRFEDEEVQEAKTGDLKEVELRCRKCRRTLATAPYLITHLPNPAKSSSSSPPTTTPGFPPPPTHSACTHHFLQPLSWMRSALEQGLLNGRLECPNPKCEAQVGRYAWQGMRCSCGLWVCPAFSLQKGRVDEITKRGLGSHVREPGKEDSRAASFGAVDEATSGGMGIRHPPRMTGKENL